MAQITLINPAQPVADFAINGSAVTVAGITVDCAAEQQDAAVTLEVRRDGAGARLGGAGDYLASIRIPGRQYGERPGVDPVTGDGVVERYPVELDPNSIQITLWPTA